MIIQDLLDRPIAFQRAFVSLGVGITGALMLSQFVYWSKRTNGNGWFYKTQEELEEETGLTRYEQEGARKKLVKLGLVDELKKGIPCKLHYKVNFEKLKELLQTSLRKTNKLESGKPTNSDEENQQSNTENTTEITTDINTRDKSLVVDDENIDQPEDDFEEEIKAITDQPKKTTRQNIPYQKIVDVYNTVCGGLLPQCLKLDKKRQSNIKKCWNLEINGNLPFQNMDFWEGYFNDCIEIKFWIGENDRGWKADIEFLTRESTVLKVLESE